jgi:uncharacterized protein YjbJ (UPF0337 family)
MVGHRRPAAAIPLSSDITPGRQRVSFPLDRWRSPPADSILLAGQEGCRHMKPSTKDQLKGKAQEIKGAIKEQVGKLSKDADLEAEGTIEKFSGKAQQVIGKIEKAAGS